MCKYHKIIKLSIVYISLASLMFNFVFPHVAIASNINRNNVLSFSYLEAVKVSPFVFEVQEAGNIKQEGAKTLASSVESTKEIKETKGVVINLTLAKNITEKEVVEISSETNDIIAAKICLNARITDLPCWQDLKAMREKESYDGKVMVGDSGKSRGWYHIQIKMHKISNECALDFECSTEWTVRNLIANGYTINRFYAISRHNGGGIMAQKYAKSVVYNSAKFEQ